MAKDYYEILGVGREATQDEIKSQMRKLALKHHPDRGGDVEKFREMWEAYEVLFDENKRKRYDSGERPAPDPEPAETTRNKTRYPSWKEMFEMWAEMSDVSTPFDSELMGGAAWPASYTGGEFENPYTGDIYTSASDIKIAKQELFLIQFEDQIELLKNDPARLTWELDKIKRSALLLKQEGWLKEGKYNEYLNLIEKKAGELERLKELKRETDEKLGLEGQYGHLQTDIESQANAREANRPPKNKGEYGHRRGMDPDFRSEWRKETGSGKML